MLDILITGHFSVVQDIFQPRRCQLRSDARHSRHVEHLMRDIFQPQGCQPSKRCQIFSSRTLCFSVMLDIFLAHGPAIYPKKILIASFIYAKGDRVARYTFLPPSSKAPSHLTTHLPLIAMAHWPFPSVSMISLLPPRRHHPHHLYYSTRRQDGDKRRPDRRRLPKVSGCSWPADCFREHGLREG